MPRTAAVGGRLRESRAGLWLGLGCFVVLPVLGGLIYGPLVPRYAREARGHGREGPVVQIDSALAAKP